MHATATVSTTFAATHDRHQVRLLVSLTGDVPVRRPPINVALVLDRSGSMAGLPLEHAREAARRFASFLTRADRLTVVAFDDQAQLLYGPGPGDDPAASWAIRQIAEGGSTNLSGGWLEGHRQVCRETVAGTNRILLLTDGQANRGIMEPPALAALITGAGEQRVSTSCIGFGPGFNEELLRDLSAAGHGHFWYVEAVDQMNGAFEGEIEGLVSLAAQNVSIEVRLTHPGVAGMSLVPATPNTHTPDGVWQIPLGDLYAVQPRTLGLILHVDALAELGNVPLGQVKVRADVLRPTGIEHQTITLPVMATLDGQDHVVPEVETSFLRFAASAAREAAVREADQGNYLVAACLLRDMAEGIDPASADPALHETRADLLAEAARLDEGVYRSEDRKYHLGRSAMARDGRGHREAQLSRRPKR